jgi:hypothetical protein
MLKDGVKVRTLAEIEADMNEAVMALEHATKDYHHALSKQADARNSVNRLQKELDERVGGLKWSAPQGTDWRRPKEQTGLAVAEPGRELPAAGQFLGVDE